MQIIFGPSFPAFQKEIKSKSFDLVVSNLVQTISSFDTGHTGLLRQSQMFCEKRFLHYQQRHHIVCYHSKVDV